MIIKEGCSPSYQTHNDILSKWHHTESVISVFDIVFIMSQYAMSSFWYRHKCMNWSFAFRMKYNHSLPIGNAYVFVPCIRRCIQIRYLQTEIAPYGQIFARVMLLHTGYSHGEWLQMIDAGLILSLRPANERRSLLCNDVSHWLGASLASALLMYVYVKLCWCTIYGKGSIKSIYCTLFFIVLYHWVWGNRHKFKLLDKSNEYDQRKIFSDIYVYNEFCTDLFSLSQRPAAAAFHITYTLSSNFTTAYKTLHIEMKMKQYTQTGPVSGKAVILFLVTTLIRSPAGHWITIVLSKHIRAL